MLSSHVFEGRFLRGVCPGHEIVDLAVGMKVHDLSQNVGIRFLLFRNSKSKSSKPAGSSKQQA